MAAVDFSPVISPEPGTPIAATLGQMKAKLGKVPNAYAKLAQSPAALDGYLAFSSALQKGRLTGPQRESLALAISQANECHDCLPAHTLTVKIAGLTPDQIRQARNAESNDPLDSAILHFAVEALQKRGLVSDADLEAARAARVDDGLMIEIIANIAPMIVANYANRLADPKIDFPVVQTQLEFAGFQGNGASLCLEFRTLQFAHTRKGTPQ